MGGQGKTQTALQYTSTFVNDYSGKVVWLDAISPESVLRSFEKVRDLVKLPDHHISDQKIKRAAVLQEMSKRTGPWLLVFDSYDNSKAFGNVSEVSQLLCADLACSMSFLFGFAEACQHILMSEINYPGLAERLC